MSNTIPNVPRELLADLLGNDHDKRIMAERHLLAMLANAPSPAGVDGLEVVGYSYGNGILINDTTQPDNPMYTKLVRLSDAQAIIDGLRGEVERLDRESQNISDQLGACGRDRNMFRAERDQHAQRIGELASHLEFAVTMLTVAGLAGNDQVEAMRAALPAGKEGE